MRTSFEDRDETVVTGEVAELLSAMIRNECVNDGTPGSGHESRNVATLVDYFGGSHLPIEVYEPVPGRGSLAARIEGTDSTAPTLLLIGHTDVVPANAANWQEDPFGGALVDGMIWGRGAVDMLNLTASMAVAMRRAATTGWAPAGDVTFVAVADEEAGSHAGAEYLTDGAAQDFRADHVLTEAGGFPMDVGSGPLRPVIVGEKGFHWFTIVVKGSPGHGSQPLRTDNALVKAAECIRRLAEFTPKVALTEPWRRFVEAAGFDGPIGPALLDPDSIDELVAWLPEVALARQIHACTHLTMTPTVVHGGSKTNVIPDTVEIELDVRSLPGQTSSEVRDVVLQALGDLAADVTLSTHAEAVSSASPVDTELWDLCQKATDVLAPGAVNVPYLTVGATDARFFRRAGSVAYGFGMFSQNITFEQYGAMFHGENERVDTESLWLSTKLWDLLIRAH